jgi:hypothetical protein
MEWDEIIKLNNLWYLYVKNNVGYTYPGDNLVTQAIYIPVEYYTSEVTALFENIDPLTLTFKPATPLIEPLITGNIEH